MQARDLSLIGLLFFSVGSVIFFQSNRKNNFIDSDCYKLAPQAIDAYSTVKSKDEPAIVKASIFETQAFTPPNAITSVCSMPVELSTGKQDTLYYKQTVIQNTTWRMIYTIFSSQTEVLISVATGDKGLAKLSAFKNF